MVLWTNNMGHLTQLVILCLVWVHMDYCNGHKHYKGQIITFSDPDFDHDCSEIAECVCSLSGPDYKAECSNPSLDHIPDNLPYNITMLSVTGSNITTVAGQNLSYDHLRSLDLSQNIISSIASGTFDHLINLEEVALDHNLLNNLPENLLQNNELLNKFYANDNLLQTMPKLAGLKHLKDVNLENNQIGSITGDKISGCSEITKLFLASNNIVSIPDGTFQDQENLLYLDLSNNVITTLNQNSFQGLKNLTEIWLRRNKLPNIPFGVLQHSSALLYLFLDHNSIDTIDSSAFIHLDNLISIDLSGNKLSSVPVALNSLAKLRTLYLRGNVMITIGPDAFGGLTSIAELFLGDMETLTELNTAAFRGLMQMTRLSLSNNLNLIAFTPDHLPVQEHPNIQHIYLNGGRFTYLDENIFSDKTFLQHVDLYSNPFNCSCDLKWMPRVIEEGVVWAQNWVVSSTPPRCVTPGHLFDWPIPQMTQDDMTCEELNIVQISPLSQMVHLKEEINFTAHLYKGLPGSKWYVPGSVTPIIPFPAGDHPLNLRRYATWKLKENNVIEATLFLDNASLPDQGDYTLLATNIKGDKTMTFDLEVLPYELTTTTIRWWETTGYVGKADTSRQIHGITFLLPALLPFILYCVY